MKLSATTLLILSLTSVEAFTPSSSSKRTPTSLAANKDGKHSVGGFTSELSRRSILTTMATVAGTMLAMPQESSAKDELFKKNPLTNPLLEQIRILEQAEADNIQYGGELAPGSPKGRATYGKLLVPILDIQSDLEKVQALLKESVSLPNLTQAYEILTKTQFDKKQFKKTFNAFADNIYYSDPDRANAYLGGGAVPKNEQSIAYLLRNDVLTQLENLQAEVAFLIKEAKAGNELEVDDLFSYSNATVEGMVKYLELVPPTEIKIAKDLIAGQ